jgi:hypothetical protein
LSSSGSNPHVSERADRDRLDERAPRRAGRGRRHDLGDPRHQRRAPGSHGGADDLDHFDADEVRAALRVAAARRIDDPNVTDREREAVRRLVERETG